MIKKSRESLLIHAKNDDNPDLITLANKLDEIVLDKSFNNLTFIFSSPLLENFVFFTSFSFRVCVA